MRPEPPLPSEHPTRTARDRVTDAAIGVTLAGVVIALYWRTAHYPFVDYDDNGYIYSNPFIHLGLSFAGVKWAFSSGYFMNWHPLTWLAYLAITTAFGVAPGPLHVFNFATHAATTGLLFIALKSLTGCRWQSAATAAVWGWHPLRVESVAWVSETKDVLAGFFAVLTIAQYGYYSRRPSAARYAGVVVTCLFALASKPTAVAMPLALLALDIWPLRRIDFSGSPPVHRAARLVTEKLPLLALAAGTAAVAFLVQRANGSIVNTIPLSARLANAVCAVAAYVGKTIWPTNLAVFYPHPALINRPPSAAAVGSAVLLAVAVTVVGLRSVKSTPYVLAGWLWFLVCLGPTIGIVQSGDQAMADRYTYLPAILLTAAFVWTAAAVVDRVKQKSGPLIAKAAAVVAAALACGGAAAVTSNQIEYWRSSTALFSRANDVTDDNYLAMNYLSAVALDMGRPDDALALSDASLRARSTPAGFSARGHALAARGEWPAAAADFRSAADGDPQDGAACAALADACGHMGRAAGREAWMNLALARPAQTVESHELLANWLAERGREAEAEQHRAAAARMKSNLSGGVH